MQNVIEYMLVLALCLVCYYYWLKKNFIVAVFRELHSCIHLAIHVFYYGT